METAIKILILEHDPNDIALLQYQLKNSGLNYTSEIVQTREAYESAIFQFKPDIILSDFSLPSFDGLSAFRFLQQTDLEIPFIIVSGTIGEENAVELIKIGVTDYALKEKIYQITPKVQRALKEANDRKKKQVAEEQLRYREEHLQRIMDLSLDIIFTTDIDGNFVTVSAASKLILDYQPEELLGTSMLELVLEPDKEKTLEAILKLKDGFDILNFENRYRRRSGAAITMLLSARWDHDDKLAYFVAKDITGLKKAEEQIRNSEKRFRTLLQNSTDGWTLLAADGTVLERSPSAIKILGLNRNEVSGKFRTDLVHPDDLFILQNSCTMVKETPDHIHTIQYRMRMPDDSYKWLEVTLNNQLHEPAVNAIVLNFRDITKNKEAEIALRKSEARLKDAQAIGHIGNWEMDWESGRTEWSDEIYRILGYEKGSIQPTYDTFVSIIHPDDQIEALEVFKRAIATLQNGSTNYRVKLLNNEVRYVMSEWRFKLDSSGKPITVFGILQDITDRKLIEMALEKSEEKYRDLFNLSPSPMYLLDVDTLQFLDVNEAAVQHYGFSREEFLAMNLKGIRPAEEIANMENAINKIKGKHYVDDFIMKHLTKQGKLIDVELKHRPLEINGRGVRLVLATDVSERMRYIHAIEEQNRKLREIAWLQSHVVRAPVARMMGLISLLNLKQQPETIDTGEILNYISISAHELDGIIREIVKNTEQLMPQ